MIEMGDIYLRKMNYDDIGMMVKWLSDKKVLEFYEESPSDLEMVMEKYGPRIEGKHNVTPCMVEYKNQPIGYIQFYKIQRADLKKYGYPLNQVIYGIDQFIGHTDLWGKGIGTSMIQLMLNYLSSQGIYQIVLEVKRYNDRAIRCYVKCGFKKIKDLNNELDLMECVLNGCFIF